MSITDIERKHRVAKEMWAAGIITKEEFQNGCKDRLIDLLMSAMSEPQDDEGIC